MYVIILETKTFVFYLPQLLAKYFILFLPRSPQQYVRISTKERYYSLIQGDDIA